MRSAVRLAACLVPLLVPLPTTAPAAEMVDLPVPRVVVYPGDIMTPEMITTRPVAASMAAADTFVRSEEDLVGRRARRTLLPDAPVPIRSIAAVRLVKRGSEVSLLLEDGALSISAIGQSLEDGGAGDLVRVRNLDSGVVVRGTVGKDGLVRIGGS